MDLLRRPIFWILLLALMLRLWGINYALPQFFINDERANVYGALKMIELETLVPAWHEDEFKKVLNYLPLPSYLYLALLAPVLGIGYLISDAPNLAAYQAHLTLDPTVIFIAARLLIALMGTATVYLVYRIARGIGLGERSALLAALFLALSFYHIQLSHVTRHWMPALFFITLAWLAALAIHRRGRMRDYLLAGMFAGLGVGANTAAAVAMIPVVLAHFLRPDRGGFWKRILDRRFALAIGVFVAVSLLFIALYPYGLTQGEVSGRNAAGVIATKIGGLSEKRAGEWLGFLWFYVRLLFTYETALIAAAVIGALLMARRYGSWVAIGAIYALVYFTLLYLFFNIIERGILFILPFLAVPAGYFADRALLWLQNRIRPTLAAFSFLFSLFFFLFFAWPLAIALRYDYLLTREDTRILAAEWLYANTLPDAKILADLPYLRLTNTKAGIRALEAIDPTGLRVQDRALEGIPDERYPQPSREVLNLHFVPPDSPVRRQAPEAFPARGYRFFVVEYKYRDRRDLDPQSRSLVANVKLLARFTGFPEGAFDRALDISGEISTVPPWRFWELERFGQIVDVYEL